MKSIHLKFLSGGEPYRVARAKVLRIMILAATLLLFNQSLKGFSACASMVPAKSIEHEMSSADVVRLAIPNFEKIGGDARYDIIGRSMPELLAVSLIDNDRIEYINHSRFWRFMRTEMSDSPIWLNPEGIDPNLIFNESALEKFNIDFILRGTFLEYKGKLRFEAILENRKTGKKTDLKSDVVDANQIYIGIEQFGKNLGRRITDIVSGGATRTVAVLCFADKTEQDNAALKHLERELPVYLATYLKPRKNIIVSPWRESEPFCGQMNLSARDIADAVNASVIIRGSFTLAGQRITITPTLATRDEETEIKLLPVGKS